MAMYDDLVGELHIVASGVQSKRRRELLEKAANAIEELDNLLNLYRQGKICRPNNDLPTSAKCGGDMNT